MRSAAETVAAMSRDQPPAAAAPDTQTQPPVPAETPSVEATLPDAGAVAAATPPSTPPTVPAEPSEIAQQQAAGVTQTQTVNVKKEEGGGDVGEACYSRSCLLVYKNT